MKGIFQLGLRFLLCFLMVLSPAIAGNAEDNKKAGVKYLAENAGKDGVQVTASGLQYKALKYGTGKSPNATDRVTVNYRGTTISGKEFDSASGIAFPLNGVIPGWTEGLQLMKEGASYRFFIPSSLAYGERGAGGAIGPNEVLIFDVDLLSVH